VRKRERDRKIERGRVRKRESEMVREGNRERRKKRWKERVCVFAF